MRTAHRAIDRGQFLQQPLHFRLLQRHIYFDSGVAGDGCGNLAANLIEVRALLLTLKAIEQLLQHFFDGASLYACGCGLHRDRSRPKWLHLETVVLEFLADLREHRLLGGRELHDDRHEQALVAGAAVARAQQSFKQHSLVGYVLVNDPKPALIHCQDEGVTDVPKGTQAVERWHYGWVINRLISGNCSTTHPCRNDWCTQRSQGRSGSQRARSIGLQGKRAFELQGGIRGCYRGRFEHKLFCDLLYTGWRQRAWRERGCSPRLRGDFLYKV